MVKLDGLKMMSNKGFGDDISFDKEIITPMYRCRKLNSKKVIDQASYFKYFTLHTINTRFTNLVS